MILRIRSLLTLSTLFIATAAFAQDRPDGRQSRAAAGVARAFKQFDLNGDGKLNGDELAGQAWLQQLDADGDASVTLEEAQKMLGRVLRPDRSDTADATPPPPFAPDATSPRQQPKVLKPGAHGIGRLAPDASCTDLDGNTARLSEIQSGKPLVVAFVSTSCPISKRYIPTLAQLEKDCRARGVAFLLVAPTATDTSEELQSAFREHGLSARCARDENGALAAALGATATTDAFLLDAARTLTYRGAIDDQYGLGYSLDAPRVRYLAAAIDATLERRTVAIAATEAPGCVLEPKTRTATAEAPTFHSRVSRVLQTNCVECHRSGGVAPFALETFEQVEAKAGMIRRMVERDLMPPWFAAAPAEGAHSPWANDRALAPGDKADLLAWLNSDRPAGDPRDAPLPRQWPAEWQIGTPDAVLQIPQPIAVKATGTMPYIHVTVETDFTEAKWVRGFEVRPTAREVVHHVLVFVLEKGRARPREDGELGGFFAAYVPGNNAVVYPDGFAKLLPAASRLVFQIHYTPNGSATQDQVRIGLLFAKEPPRHIVHVVGIGNHRLNIPAGAEHHAESGAVTVPRTVKLIGLMPHMHVRGKAFRYEVILPGGEVRTLLDVPRYDFNWQLAYRYAEPPTIPAGSRVRATGWYDNSANNPANPDPNKTVRWGPQTTDEMMLGYVEYYFPEGDGPGAAPGATAAR